MCMKNMNITTEFFDSDLSDYAGVLQFGKALGSIKAVQRSEKNFIDNLTIATFVCAMSSSDDEELIQKYKIRWTFGKISKNDNDVIFDSYVVSEAIFDPNINKKNKVSTAVGHSFSNQIFKFTLRDFEIDCADEYYLKVFIQPVQCEEWFLQSMNSISVEI